MNKFLGDVGYYFYLHKIKLIDIKYVKKEDYSYFFYTFLDNHGNTIISKEKSEIFYPFVKYTCRLTGRIINGFNNKEWNDLVKVDIQNGVLRSVLQLDRMTRDEIYRLKRIIFGGDQRINYYNPKTMEIFNFNGENSKRKIEVGDVITATCNINKHITFNNINQNIVDNLKISDVECVD